MNRNLIIYFIFFVLVFSFLIMPSNIVSAITPEASYVKIHCNVNISYIENNLCTVNDCSPKVSKSGDDYYIDDEDATMPSSFTIEPADGIIRYYTWVKTIDNITTYEFYISDNASEFLIQACEPDITPVLNYLQENNITADYNNFYTYKPEGDNVKKIDETWYLKSSSFGWKRDKTMDYAMGFLYCSFLTPLILFEFLFMSMALMIVFPYLLIILITIILVLFYIDKKIKIKVLYLLPVFLGLLGGITGSLVGYFKYKDKKLALYLLLVGLIISIILFIFYAYFVILTFPI